MLWMVSNLSMWGATQKDNKDCTYVLFKAVMWQRNYEYVITQTCKVLTHVMFQQGLFKFQTIIRTNKNKKYSLKKVNSLFVATYYFCCCPLRKEAINRTDGIFHS